MKKTLVILACFLSISCFSQKSFDYNSISHFTFGVTSGSLASSYIGKNNKERIIAGTFSGLFFGILKELRDNVKSPGTGNLGDVVPTTAGGLFGSLIVNSAIKKGTRKKRKDRVESCKM